MNMEHNVYCVSNASTDIFDNVLTSFKNLFPSSLILDDRKCEIGLVAIGVHLNFKKNPELIQIHSSVISDIPNNDNYSTIIYSTSLPPIADDLLKNSYFFHHANRISYYPVRHTDIESIEIKLTDVFGNKLPIKEGQPTIVHLHLKETDKSMDYEISYVRLDSKVDAKIDYKNRNNSFWVHLKHPIRLNEGAAMALSDISFPNAIKTYLNIINEGNEVIHVAIKDRIKSEKLVPYEIQFPSYNCKDEITLVNKINSVIPEAIKDIFLFEMDNGYLKIINLSSDRVSLFIPKFLLNPLGLHGPKLRDDVLARINMTSDGLSIGVMNGEYIAPEPMNVCQEVPGVMVLYANTVQHSIVGSNFYPILKIMPTHNTTEVVKPGYTTIHFDHLEYIKCNDRYLDNMKFEFRGLDGRLINFSDEGRIILNIVIKNPK